MTSWVEVARPIKDHMNHSIFSESFYSRLLNVVLARKVYICITAIASFQTAKYDGLYPLFSVSLTVPPFVEHFQQHDDPCRVGRPLLSSLLSSASALSFSPMLKPDFPPFSCFSVTYRSTIHSFIEL